MQHFHIGNHFPPAGAGHCYYRVKWTEDLDVDVSTGQTYSHNHCPVTRYNDTPRDYNLPSIVDCDSLTRIQVVQNSMTKTKTRSKDHIWLIIVGGQTVPIETDLTWNGQFQFGMLHISHCWIQLPICIQTCIKVFGCLVVVWCVYILYITQMVVVSHLGLRLLKVSFSFMWWFKCNFIESWYVCHCIGKVVYPCVLLPALH